jgi:hypothetical protein
LEAFTQYVNWSRLDYPGLIPPEQMQWTHVALGTMEDGKPVEHWGLWDLSVSDATGNSLNCPTAHDQLLRAPSRPGEVRGAFVPGGLCQEETAWKVRATFVHIGQEDPRHADLYWTVRGVAVPAPGAITRSDATTAQHGVALRLLGLWGRGAPLSREAEGSNKEPQLHVQVINKLRQRLKLELWATDERGMAVASGDSFHLYDPDTEEECWFYPKIPPGAKAVNLTFAVWKHRTFEFLARPVPA